MAQRLRSKDIPATHTNLEVKRGELHVTYKDQLIPAYPGTPRYTVEQFQGNPQGHEKGLIMDFGNPELGGIMYYGFIPYGDSKHPHPVYFRAPSAIEEGRAFINLDALRGRYDMIGWEESGQGTIGYRIVDAEGNMLYDGMISFEGRGPFEPAPTLIEGPFVNLLTSTGATISFTTNESISTEVSINGQTFESDGRGQRHEIAVSGLEPGTSYAYTVRYGNMSQTYSLQTAPAPGSRQPFVFAYASDSRSGQGGGERDLYGANFYIMKKMLALTRQQGAAFMQFSGDMINGYLTSKEETRLQYANWKRAVQPFAHYFPIYISMGNHEALVHFFQGEEPGERFSIDRFPYETESSEAVFAEAFVNPENGPDSEDGAVYDPDPEAMDFPSYKENVFYYTYDNVGVIVLNSDYWYSPSYFPLLRHTGGGLHGYIMDQQLAWLEETLQTLENDPNIDHVFLTQHTPCFPNGGHVQDDMWYNGSNQFRPYVAGSPLKQGIIERRDAILDLVVNKSEKVIAILTGDEHNYARTRIDGSMSIYTDEYFGPRITLNRTIHQINNGAAGAPYYAQQETPWTDHVSGFTTQNALVFFYIDGPRVRMSVLNPDTLEEIDELELR